MTLKGASQLQLHLTLRSLTALSSVGKDSVSLIESLWVLDKQERGSAGFVIGSAEVYSLPHDDAEIILKDH